MLLAGRYRLLRPLGQGSFGEVWHAIDEQLSRDVAVKVMLSTHSDPLLFKRFEREAFTAARLRHPGIVQVREVGWQGNQMYIVMELLIGSDLAQVMQANTRGLPVTQAVDLAIQVADALSVVHAEGIIHRDIKPANLFVQGLHALKILDFGIARDYNDGTITLPGQTIGTPAYMAPELWEGTTRASESSDLYALGCVLYEMLIGRSPFAGEMALVPLYQRHKNETPTSPSARNRRVPPAVSALVLDLLAKQTAARPVSAAEVAKRLRDAERSVGREPRDLPQPAAPSASHAATIPNVEAPAVSPARSDPVRVSRLIACASVHQGHIEVFLLRGSSGIWHCRLWPESGHADWQAVPPPAKGVSGIAAGSYDDDLAELAAVVGDTVYHKRWMNGRPSGWDAMPPLGAEVIDVAFASMMRGRLEVFALDDAGQIRQREWPVGNGWWSEWRDMASPDGHAATALAAGSHSERQEELFAIADGVVWHRSWSATDDGFSDWSQWQQIPLPHGRAVDLACSSSATRHLVLFALDAAGEVYCRSHSSRTGWSGWTGLSAQDGHRTIAITAGWHVDSSQAVFLRVTSDGAVRCARARLGDIGQPTWSWRVIAS
jgi:serine/threonine protein kinase